MSVIFIRADGNSKIGSGHVMRCLSVAHALRGQGAQVFFVCADETMRGRIEQAGFAFLCLDSGYRDMEKELPALFALIQEKQPGCILLDSYFVTPGYMQALRSQKKLIYMDDQNTFLYPADMVVNYNLFSSEMGYEKRYAHTGTQLVLGCRYTPLRQEFQKLPPRTPPKRIRNILVSTGGADPMGIGMTLLRYAKEKSGYAWHFIVGGLSARAEEMQACAAGQGFIHLHRDVTHMAQLMCSCDLAVSASGSTLYELCAAGTPACCYTFADNQTAGTEIFSQKGLMCSLGDYRLGPQAFLKKLDCALAAYTSAPQEWGRLSRRMQTVVDGLGAERLAEKILSLI